MGQTANLTAEAGDYQWTSPVGADAELIPELEFDQTLGWQFCAAVMAHAAEDRQAWCSRWQSALNVQRCRCLSVQIRQFGPVALRLPLGIFNKIVR